jgi:hypothetical protein
MGIVVGYKVAYAQVIAFKMFIDKLMISIPVLS